MTKQAWSIKDSTYSQKIALEEEYQTQVQNLFTFECWERKPTVKVSDSFSFDKLKVRSFDRFTMTKIEHSNFNKNNKLYKFAAPNFLLAWDQHWQSHLAHFGSQSKHKTCFILPRVLPA